MLERYVDRPDESFCDGRYCVLNKFSYADILRFYYTVPSAKKKRLAAHRIKRRAGGV